MVAGGRNARGLYQVHSSTAPIGISEYQPIQSRDQTARASRAGIGMRVQTLHGLECRRQPSSSRPNAFVMWVSVVSGVVVMPISVRRAPYGRIGVVTRIGPRRT